MPAGWNPIQLLYHINRGHARGSPTSQCFLHGPIQLSNRVSFQKAQDADVLPGSLTGGPWRGFKTAPEEIDALRQVQIGQRKGMIQGTRLGCTILPFSRAYMGPVTACSWRMRWRQCWSAGESRRGSFGPARCTGELPAAAPIGWSPAISLTTAPRPSAGRGHSAQLQYHAIQDDPVVRGAYLQQNFQADHRHQSFQRRHRKKRAFCQKRKALSFQIAGGRLELPT